jgi:DNA-binding response OmpR family regulator
VNRQVNTKSILLVEDSDDDAFFFQYALDATQLPCVLTRLADGAQALKHFAAIKAGAAVPDLIFLDLKLPGYSGFEILHWIREQDFHVPLRIAILSGSDHQADIVMARELGVSDYIVKPISSDELKKRILAPPSEFPEMVAARSDSPG